MSRLGGRRSRLFPIVLVALVLGSGGPVLFPPRIFTALGATSLRGTPGSVTRTVQATTSTASARSALRASTYESRSLPLMVGFHGTGGKGSLMILRLQALAEREGFTVLAPDPVSISGVWSVTPQRPDGVAEDYRHVMACVREVLQVPGVRMDSGARPRCRILRRRERRAVRRDPERVFTTFAVLHGHVAPGCLGSSPPPSVALGRRRGSNPNRRVHEECGRAP